MRTGILVGREGYARFQAGFGQEALRERGQGPVGEIEFDALDAVHGEENDGGGERLTILHHDRKIFKGCQFRPAEAQAFGG